MVEFKWTEWNKISLFLILVLHFTAIKGREPHLTVRVGGEVTLPCENRTKDQLKCSGTTWLFSARSQSPAVELINLGQVGENDKTKSDRLSVTEDCSLVVKKLTVKDSGQYSCRQFDKSRQEVSTVLVYLSLINIHEDRDAMTLTCSVLSYKRCGHTVEWLNEGVRDDRQSSQVSCSTTVTFKTSPDPKYEASLRCKVTDSDGGNLLLCNVSSQSSCDKMGTSVHSVDSNKQDDGCQKANDKCSSTPSYFPQWWWFILVAVGLAALLITVAALIRRRRTRGNKTRMDDDAKPSLTPAVTQAPDTSPDTADPEDVVSYASVSYIKKTGSKARVQVDEEVTYSAVNVPTEATKDPSSLYASVNKPTKMAGHNKVTSHINTLVYESDDK